MLAAGYGENDVFAGSRGADAKVIAEAMGDLAGEGASGAFCDVKAGVVGFSVEDGRVCCGAVGGV